jgi:hypothetical protein
VRHRQVGLVPLAGLPPVDPGVMRARPGIAGLPLEVAEARPGGLPDHRVDLGDKQPSVDAGDVLPVARRPAIKITNEAQRSAPGDATGHKLTAHGCFQ